MKRTNSYGQCTVINDSEHLENWTDIFNCLTSSEASERVSAAERVSKASSAEQANE